ncbi:hypothetical protein NCS57_00627900 [Fusarium keratoplasticum]|uniref:Uncharacterized protein n=1 Tax=Fusarium keratoplasticum TaxID=1328300 RepID=A0ACC0R194_9HYPO|nr:hypothetical protein NCS57_00627900 [Fusarium keratoplasticum]KAI8671524.1 hypothetical protein NCS57_00627900 [Fusarium keratoplasticum]
MDSDNTDDGHHQKVLPMWVSSSNFDQAVVPLKPGEVELHTEAWMMRDLTNRGFYVGNSSTSSSLVVISTVVGFVSGDSSFTGDPDRFKMPEAPFIAPSSPQTKPLLPEIKHARILTKSFFDNTQGLLWVLDPNWTDMALNRVYAAPDSAAASDRCLIYLVLAIGFTMGPVSLSPGHDAVIHEMRMLDDQWGERLFAAAKSIGDPMTAFEDEGWSEDGGLWSVQALALMSYFTLLVSRRNAAYAYCGMAVRSAYALGIHMAPRTDVLFTDQHVKLLRRNIWRSLFILDRFLAASLGRPLAMSEQDCSHNSLQVPAASSNHGRSRSVLDASVEVSDIISQVLNKIYSSSRICSEAAHGMMKDLEAWSRRNPSLTKMSFPTAMDASALARAWLKAHILGHYANILLCRPFFLDLFMKTTVNEDGLIRKCMARPSRITCELSERCVYQSLQMIKLVKWAMDSHEMRVFDSLTLHILFDAALIVLSNDYAGIHNVPHAEFWITQAMGALKMSAGPHRHADKFVGILESFRQAKKGERSEECWKKDVGLAGNGERYQLSTGSFVQVRPPSCSPVNDAWISPCESRRGSLATMYPWGTQNKDGGPLGSWPTVSLTDNNTPQSQGLTDGTGSSHGEEGEVGFDWRLSKK